MSTPAIMDAVAVGAAVLLAAIGAWRGLMKTVMGIIIFIVAMIGAGIIVSWLSGPLTDRAVTFVMERAEEQLQERMRSQTREVSESLEAAIADIQSTYDYDSYSDTISLGQIPELLERIGLSRERQNALMDTIREKLSSLGQSTAKGSRVMLEDVVRHIIAPIIRSALYGLSFFLLSLILRTMLKGIADTLGGNPAMKAADRTGGLLLGLVEGALLLTVASWILRTAGFTVDAPPLSETVVLRFLAEHSLVDLLPAAHVQV